MTLVLALKSQQSGQALRIIEPKMHRRENIGHVLKPVEAQLWPEHINALLE